MVGIVLASSSPNYGGYMGKTKATTKATPLQGLILAWVKGELPFDAPLAEPSYFSGVAQLQDAQDRVIGFQVQLRAARKLLESGAIESEDYETVRLELDEEYNCAPEGTVGDTSPTFSPWSPVVQSRPIPAGWGLDANGVLKCLNPQAAAMAGLTGRVEEDTGDKRRFCADPVRHKSGRFLANVAEVWYYDPVTWVVRRQTFTAGKDPIATAWARAKTIALRWAELGVTGHCVWVKYREGELSGPRWVQMAAADGIVAPPHEVVRLDGQADSAGIKAKVGERVGRTSRKSIAAMIEQNVQLRKVLGFDTTTGKMLRGGDLDIPTVELPDSNELVYRLRFQSGDMRIESYTPLSDIKDKETGEVTMPGHKKRAYKLLLESPSSSTLPDGRRLTEDELRKRNRRGRASDAPCNIKYTVPPQKGKDGAEDIPEQTFVIGRDEALRWSERIEEDDREIEIRETYTQKGDNGIEVIPGQEDAFTKVMGKYLNEKNPADPRRGIAAYHQNRGSDKGPWMKAQNSGGPGYNWAGRMAADKYGSAPITGGSNWSESVNRFHQ
jgi:hypothetical protein